MRIIFGAGVLVAVAFLAGAFMFSDRLCTPQDFSMPIQVTGTSVRPDGGSMNIDFVDSAGKRWGIVRIGSLDVDPSKQELFVVRWFSVISVRCSASAGSLLERAVKRSLVQWKSGKLTDEQGKLLAQGHKATFIAVPSEVVDVWAFTNWLDTRH